MHRIGRDARHQRERFLNRGAARGEVPARRACDALRAAVATVGADVAGPSAGVGKISIASGASWPASRGRMIRTSGNGPASTRRGGGVHDTQLQHPPSVIALASTMHPAHHV
jgi:hypothetical protein